MKRLLVLVFVPFAPSVLWAACSSSNGQSPADGGDEFTSPAQDAPIVTGDEGDGGDAGPSVDPEDCISITASANEAGVGAYCSPDGDQCKVGGANTNNVCSADFDAPEHEWFCSVLCTSSADCGPGGGSCYVVTGGVAICVPPECKGFLKGRDASLLGEVDGGGLDGAVHHDGSADARAADAREDAPHVEDAHPDGKPDVHAGDAAAADATLDAPKGDGA